jgi:hypothetical protein
MAYPGCINVPFIDASWKSILPTQEQLDDWLSKDNCGGSLHTQRLFPSYVKLHGSSGWLMEDSKLSVPIIGKFKSEQIRTQPLLKWYMELFTEQLNEKLDIWIIGYSFSDPHINELLMKTMKNHQSSLFVIDIKSQNVFMDHLKTVTTDQFYSALDERLAGYFPCSLKQIFPLKEQSTYYNEMLERSFNRTKITDILDDVITIENSLIT